MYKKTISSKSTTQYSKCYCSPIHTQCATRKFVAVTLQECTTRLIKNYLHYANRKSTLNAWARLQAIMGWLHAFSVTAPTKARRFVYYALRLAGRWFGRIDELLKRHLCDSVLFLPDNSDTTLHITEQFTPHSCIANTICCNIFRLCIYYPSNNGMYVIQVVLCLQWHIPTTPCPRK